MNPKKTILITGVGGSASVFLINHLKKNNFRVIAIDTNPHANGLLHGDLNFIVPNCLDTKYVLTVQNICKQENVSFIIPLIDEELTSLKALESKKLKIICPTIKFINICLDKFILMQELAAIGIATPKTWLLSEDTNHSHYPLVIKPRTGRGSRDVFIVNDSNELNKIKLAKKNQLDDFLIQEKITGTEYTVSVVINPDNRYVTVVPKKIIEKKGITKSAVTEKNWDITNSCKNIARKLKPCNSFNVQLITNNLDNKPYVFEINPRYSTTITLTINAGVDEIMAPLNFYLRPQIITPENFTEGMVLLRSTKEEFVSSYAYSKKVAKITRLQTP